MSEGWREIELGDVITLQRGFDLPKKERCEGDVPIVSSSGITGYHNESQVSAPGVVTGRYGTLGEVFYISERPFWPLNTTLFVRDFHGNDVRYASYLLKSLDLASYNSASSVPGVNRNTLHRIPILLPPIQTQRRIAAILGALDDKIDVNRRINRTLEAMARALYKHWFVDFGPFADEEFVESELGWIPRGWEVATLSENCALTMGLSPKSKYYNEVGEGLPFHQGVTDFNARFPTHRRYCTVKKRVVNSGTILISVRAPVGRINVADRNLIIGRGVAGVNRRDESNSFLLYQLHNTFPEEDTMGSGTIYNSITKKDLLALSLISPPDEVVEDFESIVQLYDNQIYNNWCQNQALAATRDYLLPKLLSGEIEVDLAAEVAGDGQVAEAGERMQQAELL